jgi:hypothetical protein
MTAATVAPDKTKNPWRRHHWRGHGFGYRRSLYQQELPIERLNALLDVGLQHAEHRFMALNRQ